MLKSKVFERKFGAAYDGLSTEPASKVIWYPLSFYARRLLVPLSVIIFPEVFIVQLSTMVATTMATIILVGNQRPFKGEKRNQSELI